jgi:hypothetical protein
MTTCPVHDERVAVEDQLVLASDHVHVHHGQVNVDDAVARDALPLALLVDFVGRGVDHDEQLRAVLARRAGGLGLPDVLADEEPELETAALDHGRLAPSAEVALLVEHPVIGKLDLAVIRGEPPVAEERRGVEDIQAAVFGVSDVHADTVHAAPHGIETGIDLTPQAAMEQQILGWIAGQRELRKRDEVGRERSSRVLRRLDDPGRIALDVAYEQVELRESNP